MTQARFTLDSYTKRVLDVVKGKYGLKNRNEALKHFVEEHGEEYAEPTFSEEYLKELDTRVEKHYKKYGFRSMSEDELDEILGL